MNEDNDDRRLSGEEAPLRADCRRARGVVPPALGVNVALFVLIDGVVGRFLYADAGITGGPIAPTVGEGGGRLLAAAAMTSLWSAGRGGGDAARDRMLPELPGLRGVRPSFECLLLGEGGGDATFSTLLGVSMAE